VCGEFGEWRELLSESSLAGLSVRVSVLVCGELPKLLVGGRPLAPLLQLLCLDACGSLGGGALACGRPQSRMEAERGHGGRLRTSSKRASELARPAWISASG